MFHLMNISPGRLAESAGCPADIVKIVDHHDPFLNEFHFDRRSQYFEDILAKKGATYIKKGEDGLGDADETVNILKERKKREDELGEERVHYEQLCRGEEFVSVAEKSKMMCRYNFGKHDFLRIGPLKEEEVFLSPRIVLFHNFLTNSEVDTIKSMATPRFKRATVQNYLTGELETANYR